MLKGTLLEGLRHSVLLPLRLPAAQRESLTWACPLLECSAALTPYGGQISAGQLRRGS